MSTTRRAAFDLLEAGRRAVEGLGLGGLGFRGLGFRVLGFRV